MRQSFYNRHKCIPIVLAKLRKKIASVRLSCPLFCLLWGGENRLRAARLHCARLKQKPVNAALLPAQSVRGAFAIVKAMGREDLGIIKITEIRPLIIPAKIMEFFTIKHLLKIISEQIFTGLLIIFTVI